MRQLLVAAESSWGSSEWLVCSGLPSTSSFTRCEDFVSGLERFCMEAGMRRSCCCTFFPARCTLRSCFAGTGLSPGHAVPGGSWKGFCREARRAAVSSAQKQCLVLTLPTASLVFSCGTARVVLVFPLHPSASLPIQLWCLFL